MYVCSCFGITDKQVKEHAEAGACTPRQIASVCKAGTDCGGCVRAIQALLGRGACPRRELLDRKRTSTVAEDAAPARPAPAGSASVRAASDPGTGLVPGVVPGARLSEAA
ncbi:bacterioferritin-associated ferredoxin [Streptomyces sp. NPDC056061]|uniref:(2Fe-2S)-binding protein n=1 Tax=Streptomyces sp. NPDC056061 TaxID=3345700 RepID=UPI0035D53752